MNIKLLLISADSSLRAAAEAEADKVPVALRVVSSPQQAYELRGEGAADAPGAVMIDLLGGNRDEAFQWTRQVFPDARVILLIPTERFAGFTSLTTPNPPAGWRPGEDFLLARSWDPSNFRAFVARLCPSQSTRQPALGVGGLDDLMGRSVPFRDAHDSAMSAVSERHVPVLISGERGVGKRAFARAIHADSYGSFETYCQIDCTAVTGRNFDAALQGEFLPAAGSSGSQSGVFGGCAGAGLGTPVGSGQGTLLLEEVGALDGSRQAKVLSYLAEGFHSIGPNPPNRTPRPRVIAATARNLEEAVKAGKFNRSLYAKLTTLRINIPPLRERPSDILLLAEKFLSQKASADARRVPTFTRPVQERLLTHPWPGNIRELFGVLEAAYEASEGCDELQPEHLPDWLMPAQEMSAPSGVGSELPMLGGRGAAIRMGEGGIIIELPEEGVAFDDMEKAILQAALQRTHSNVVRAAKLLRLGRGSLRYRLEKYGLVEPKRRRSAKRRPTGAMSEDKDGLRRAS